MDVKKILAFNFVIKLYSKSCLKNELQWKKKKSEKLLQFLKINWTSIKVTTGNTKISFITIS